jgi:hypothetical protein
MGEKKRRYTASRTPYAAKTNMESRSRLAGSAERNEARNIANDAGVKIQDGGRETRTQAGLALQCWKAARKDVDRGRNYVGEFACLKYIGPFATSPRRTFLALHCT